MGSANGCAAAILPQWFCSKSLFVGILEIGVNSRENCLLLFGAVREGQEMFSKAGCACTTSPVASRCCARGPVVYSRTLQFISAKISDQFSRDCQW